MSRKPLRGTAFERPMDRSDRGPQLRRRAADVVALGVAERAQGLLQEGEVDLQAVFRGM